jgi:hypothetical protein
MTRQQSWPRWHRLVLVLLAASSVRCAGAVLPLRPGYVASSNIMPPTGPLTVQNQSGYLSYHSATYQDGVDYRFVRRTRGEACQRGVGFPLGAFGNKESASLTADIRWGNGTLNEAMRRATYDMGPEELLVDVTIDMQRTSVLAILYRQMCLQVEGVVVAPAVPEI